MSWHRDHHPELVSLSMTLLSLLLSVVAVATAAGAGAAGALPAATRAESSPAGPAAAAGDSAAIFVIQAAVFQEDGLTPWTAPDTLVIANPRNGLTSRGVIGATGTAHWAAVLVDLAGSAAVVSGDSLALAFTDSILGPLPFHWVATPEAVHAGEVELQIRVGFTNSQVPQTPAEPGISLRVVPNPVRQGATRVELRLAGSRSVDYAAGHDGADDRVAIFDVQGRLVRRLVLQAAPGGLFADWDGRDATGRPTADGTYWVCVERSGIPRAEGARFVMVR